MVNIRQVIDDQVKWSRRFDRFLPPVYTVDGNRDFLDNIVPYYLRRGMRIYDIGGGKNPVIDAQTKKVLDLTVIGLDIEREQLEAAPAGIYDEIICADIAHHSGGADADLVICQAVLEHTLDNEAVLRSIASILRPGACALIFTPSRNAVYARLNLLLPEKLKCRVMSAIYPEMSRDHGFPARYDRCTPARLTKAARAQGLALADLRLYFHSVYFQFCAPLYLIWRLWVVLFRRLAGSEAAETFACVFRKDGEAPPPKILFGLNSLFAVRHLAAEMLSFVRRKGYDVIVAAPPGPSSATTVQQLSATFYPIAMQREISPAADVRSLWQLWRLMKQARPDISDMSTPKMGLLGGLAAAAARVPCRLYTLRGLRYETTRSWKRLLLMAAERIACACAHQVIAISNSVREKAIRDGIVPPKNIITLGERVSEGIRIQPAIETIPNSSETRRRLRIPENAQVVGFVGRLTRDKGIPELVECMRILHRQGREVHLFIAGDFEAGDPVDAATEKWIRSNPRCHWMGYVPDPRPLYQIMDVFVFPTHREGLGKVLLEAGAAGKAVVSTLTTGVVDAVQDGVTGLLVPPGDSEDLARATAKLLDNRHLAEQMGAAARQLVEEQYDNTIYMERLATVLESFTHHHPAPLEACPEMRG